MASVNILKYVCQKDILINYELMEIKEKNKMIKRVAFVDKAVWLNLKWWQKIVSFVLLPYLCLYALYQSRNYKLKVM